MKIENLKIFLTVAQTGSMHKTAEIFFTSNQNISFIIKNMEKKLGVSLFTRDNKGMYLTHDGKAFLKFVEPFIKELDDFIKERNTEKVLPEFHLYAPPSLMQYIKFIPNFVYSDAYYLSMGKRNVNEMLDMLSNNQPGIYIVPVFSELSWMKSSHGKMVSLGKDNTIFVSHVSNTDFITLDNAWEKLKKYPTIISSYFQAFDHSQIILNIEDIDVCKKYLREKRFCYSTNKFMYNKNFNEPDEWKIIYEDKQRCIEYMLILNLTGNDLKAAEAYFIKPLKQLFDIN